jgi:hypothetical protein
MATKRGGYRESNPGGRPREWESGIADTSIKVPKAIRDEVLRLAKELDKRLAREQHG